jgi:hypothetical protein
MKPVLSLIAILTAALLFLLFGIDPRSTPSFVLVVPFVLLFAILLLIAFRLLRSRGQTSRASWGIATSIAALPTLLLLLQSIGQLTIRDMITIIALFAIIYFYVVRANAPIK